MKFGGNSMLSTSIGTIFPIFVHFVSVCHNLVILTIFQTLWLLLGLLSVIFDVTIVIVLGSHEPHPGKTGNFIDKYCTVAVLNDLPNGLSPVSFPLLRSPYPLRHKVLKSGQLITLQWPLNVQVKERLFCVLL